MLYVNHLHTYFGLGVGYAAYHWQITALVGVWAILGAIGWRLARRGPYHPFQAYVTTALDAGLLTAILGVSDGTHSPLIVVYYLVIATAGFRYSRILPLWAAGLCVAGYMVLTLSGTPEPLYARFIKTIAMALMGLMAGTIVGRFQKLVGRAVTAALSRQRVEGMFSRYVSHQVARHLLDQGESALTLPGRRCRVTVVMTDIRGFTTLSSSLPPEEVVSLLNEYFEKLVPQVFAHEGTLDKFIGDAMLIVFGAPLPQDDQEIRACRLALALQRAVAEVSAERATRGHPTVTMGIGINTGEVVAGAIGTPERQEYTVLGDPVNVTARLEGIAAGGTILLTEATYRRVADRVRATPLPPVMVKGKADPLVIHQLLEVLG